MIVIPYFILQKVMIFAVSYVLFEYCMFKIILHHHLTNFCLLDFRELFLTPNLLFVSFLTQEFIVRWQVGKLYYSVPFKCAYLFNFRPHTSSPSLTLKGRPIGVPQRYAVSNS